MGAGLLLDSCWWVTSAAARVYLIADDKTRLCLLIDGLLEQLPETILLVDKAARAMRVKREFIRIFGSLQKEIIGRALVLFIVPEEFRKCAPAWRK
jgi:PAS domain-containing protein